MALKTLNCTGLRCPQPILKMATVVPELNAGDILEVSADCPTFEKDVRVWCERMKKTLLWIRNDGGMKKCCQIKF